MDLKSWFYSDRLVVNVKPLKQFPREKRILFDNFDNSKNIATLGKEDVIHLANGELAVSCHVDVRLDNGVVFWVDYINF